MKTEDSVLDIDINDYHRGILAAEEVEQNKLAGERVIDEVIFCTVGEPTEKKEKVEEEIKLCLANVGVTVMKMQTFCNDRVFFDQCRVRMSPVNSKKIIGQRLGIKKCRVMECNPPPNQVK